MLDSGDGAELLDQFGLSDQIQINLIHCALALPPNWLKWNLEDIQRETVALKCLFASHLKRIVDAKNTNFT